MIKQGILNLYTSLCISFYAHSIIVVILNEVPKLKKLTIWQDYRISK